MINLVGEKSPIILLTFCLVFEVIQWRNEANKKDKK